MLEKKYQTLLGMLQSLGNVAVAFSGGVDSAFLLRAAKEALGEQVMAITAQSPAFPESEARDAQEFCECYGIRQITFSFDSLKIPEFRSNPRDRCYHCKKALLTEMRLLITENGFDTLAEGSNMDDTGDYRPGMRAITELGIISPLKEAGFFKEEIRALSHSLGLSTADKPSYACLATRIPYGDEITREKLGRIEQAERLLHELGFRQARVRVHETLARIEIMPEQFEKIMQSDIREKITRQMKAYGFSYVSLDLQGYRTGSMNN